MIRSMFTAISSLNLHQKYLDVVANNLANANTTGYKGSRVLFQDQVAQLLSPGAGPTATQGGTNPIQVGLGVTMGYISPNFTQGMLQSTGRNMDLAVQGDGFFIYGQDVNQRYSREGSMSMDATGYLVNSATGLRTQGWMVPTGDTVVDTNLPVDDIQVNMDKTLAKATGSVIVGGNLSSTTAVAAAAVGTTPAVLAGTVTVSMGVYDSLGSLRKALVTFTRGATTTPAPVPPAVATTWDWKVTDPADTTTTINAKYKGAGTISFDANGQYVSVTNPTPVVIPGSGGAVDVAPKLDLTKMTMLSSDNSLAVTSQDGLPAGNISDVFISAPDGAVYLVYTNGLRDQVGQVALARFTNPTGLMRAENTTFVAGLNSGEAGIGAAGVGGRGAVASSYLEASNVDMAQEFTNMILAQRGFQASSRVITTSDEILQELVNLKR
jgi:flagellar hook protein FlgE